MNPKVKSKITSIWIFRNILIIMGVLFPFIMFFPKDRELLDSSPSSIGFAEITVFLTHLIMGLSIYFIFLLLNRFNNIKIILSLSLVYLIFIDLDIFMYKKNWLIIGILLVRIIQLYILSLLFKANLNKHKTTIGIVVLLILIGWFYIFEKF